ncbi:patatin-like phospholipase family protein [Streptomyces sp. NPDC047043]|uniref:patatin-like phospholipase family protein n=1 Tax=Streptomyces sp. NPDC047043 TaxID=3154497 RepID=UPI00341054F0
MAAQIGSGTALSALLRAQVDPALQKEELKPREGALTAVFEFAEKLDAEVTDPVERLRRTGEMALAAETVTGAERRSVIEGRLPSHSRPERALAVVAVNAATGKTRLFDRVAGAGLVDAVSASCAIPGVRPATTIGAGRCIDGGIRSFTNLDLAADHARTLVVAPMPDPVLEADAAAIAGRGGGLVEVVVRDEDSLAAVGPDPLPGEQDTGRQRRFRPGAGGGTDGGRPVEQALVLHRAAHLARRA